MGQNKWATRIKIDRKQTHFEKKEINSLQRVLLNLRFEKIDKRW